MRLQTHLIPMVSTAESWSFGQDLDSPQSWVLAFCSPELASSPELLRQLKGAFPTSHVMGCSTAGEIHGATLSDKSVSLAIARFSKSTLRSASAAISDSGDSRAAGVSLGKALAGPDLKAVFLLSDGLCVNGTDLVAGLNEVLPPSVVVTGGLAGDGANFRRTWVLKDGEPVAGQVSAIGFYGPVAVRHGSKGGWDVLGPERLVTKSSGNVLYELDGAPALDLYVKYLGDRAAGLPATALLFPLSLRHTGAGEEGAVVRTILAVDKEAKTMTFAGDIPEGSLVRLMRANFDRLVEGAAQAATQTLGESPAAGASLCVAVSCVGRRLVLGQRTEEELEATVQQIGDNVKQVGFYSYGELSPHTSGRCELHNQTMTLTTFSEAD